MWEGGLTYDVTGAGTLIQQCSWNAVSVTNGGAGIWTCVFSHVSRTGDIKRFLLFCDIALGDVQEAHGRVTTIGADTITIQVDTWNNANPRVLANASFSVAYKELG